ncbi:DUF6586 family protein [Marinobacter sp. F4206]|uniref:DUF6586 family protein n=1 Tax=Marinobacter sp. F4206 TaxID=2861777 RepID=UPI001C5CF56F|nr:DUF6586 family protein [Marinobacter sp. F4206]MBW4933724.1 hypothetical protein [Marinobacter sp. F4206]
MASQWHSLVSQKLFLARTLLSQLENDSGPMKDRPATEAELAMGREAVIQGAIELLLRSRRLLLVMIARLYQKRSEEPATLDELAALIGEAPNDIARLRELESQPGSWWNHLDQMEASQSRPPVTRKSVSAENIIAVSADTGPDRSAQGLRRTLGAMKNFADDLEEQHSEW